MKRTLLLLPVAAMIYLVTASNDNGASNAPSGVQTAKTGCGGSGCHGAANTTATITVNLIDKATSIPVTDNKYSPGKTYTVSVGAMQSGTQAFGYITMVTDAANAQAGTLANAASGSKITTKTGFTVAEHSAPIAAVGSSFATTFDWTAPVAGKGAITFYTAVNCTNDNNNADAGDTYKLTSKTFAEGVAIRDIDNSVSIALFPNPAVNTISLDIQNSTIRTYQYTIYNISGAAMQSGNAGNGISTADISALSQGAYFLSVNDGSARRTITFNKI